MKYVLGLVGVWLVACLGCLDLKSSPGTGGAGAGGSGSGGGGSGGAECIPNAPCTTSLLGVCAQGLQSCDASMTCVPSVEPSTERCDTAEDESCDGKGCSGTAIWSARFGDSLDQAIMDVDLDSQGNIVLAGWFRGVLDFGSEVLTSAGEMDLFVVKLDSLGKLIWTRRFGDASWQGVEKIAIDSSDNIIVVGDNGGTINFGNDVVVADPMGGGEAYVGKLDPNGMPLWIVQSSGPGYQGAYAVCLDNKGNIITTGEIGDVANFGGGQLPHAGGGDILVWKLDANGNHIWSKSYGDMNYQAAWSVVADAQGNIYFTGVTSGPVDFGGGLKPSAGTQDAILVKLDASGKHVWSKVIGNDAKQVGLSVATDADANVALTLNYFGTINLGGNNLESLPLTGDWAIAKFDTAGNHLWSKRLFGTDTSGDLPIAFDPVGNLVIAGATDGSVDFGGGPLVAQGKDLVVAKLDPNGKHVWSERYGGVGAALLPREITIGKLGDTWVGGTLKGAATIGKTMLESAGQKDIFVAHFDP